MQTTFNGHTLVYGHKMFKWDGKTFHIYEMNAKTLAYELIGKEEKPVLRSWLGIHFMRIYMNGNVGIRAYVHSEYTGRKLDYIAYPIVYKDGSIAWDNPYLISNGIRKNMESVLYKLWQEGIL